MKVIIAGSRDITDYKLITEAIKNSGFDIDEVVCGMASGIDILGASYAQEKEIPPKEMPANWYDLTKPCILKYKNGKPYNALAGFKRNEQMASYADALILIHHNTKGSLDMLKRAKKHGLKIYEVII